ncbi:MAG: GNAT family N-acetyltransferase, partial [Acidimicrobiales bacterium]
MREPDADAPGRSGTVPSGSAGRQRSPSSLAFALPWPPLVDAERGIGLRPWGAADADAAALAAAWADPEVARRNQVPGRHDEAAAAAWIAGEAQRRSRGLAVDLVVFESGRPDLVVGEVGLVMVDRLRRWGEVGYWTVASARGHGLATAAVALFSRWALAELSVAR